MASWTYFIFSNISWSRSVCVFVLSKHILGFSVIPVINRNLHCLKQRWPTQIIINIKLFSQQMLWCFGSSITGKACFAPLSRMMTDQGKAIPDIDWSAETYGTFFGIKKTTLGEGWRTVFSHDIIFSVLICTGFPRVVEANHAPVNV